MPRRYLELSNLRDNSWQTAGQIQPDGGIQLDANVEFPKAVSAQDRVRAVWFPLLLDFADEESTQGVRWSGGLLSRPPIPFPALHPGR